MRGYSANTPVGPPDLLIGDVIGGHRKLGITSLENSSIDRITLACFILPKDMLAPK